MDSLTEAEEWDQDADPLERANQNKAVDRRLMVTAVILSLALHIALGSSLLNVSFSPPQLITPETVSVRLIPELLPAPPPPQVELVPEEPDPIEVEEPEQLPVEALAEVEESETESAEPLEEIPAELLAETPLETETTDITPDPIDSNPPLPLPSIDVIQSAVQQDFIEQQLEDRSWASTCTNLQRRAGVIGCVSQDEPDIAGIEQSPESRAIYNFHNPVAVRSRTDRTIRTITGNSALVAANLANADIPEGLGEFMMAELESTITFYSEASNRVQQNMDMMTNTSDAALIARSLFDPWVRQQLRERQIRRVQNRQEMQLMAECGSPKLLVLAVTELEKFADCVTRENNFLFRLAPLLL